MGGREKDRGGWIRREVILPGIVTIMDLLLHKLATIGSGTLAIYIGY